MTATIDEAMSLETDDCVGWLGDYDTAGYPVTFDKRRVHRLLWSKMRGELAPGHAVARSCRFYYPQGDKSYRRCVNPRHLRLQTTTEILADNLAYASQRSRNVGMSNPSSKLDDDAVRAIREERAARKSVPDIAKLFNVSPQAVYNVLRGKTWAHVED